MLRLTVLAIGAVETLLWLLTVPSAFNAFDPATRGLDHALAIAASAVFVLTTVPAVALALANRSLKLALFLTLLPFIAALAGMVWWYVDVVAPLEEAIRENRVLR